MRKKIFYGLLIILVGIQFIRPEKNQSATASPNDMVTHYAVPDEVLSILKRSCFDCHSNYTNYPWYSNIQPVAWWLADHIKEGKGELNFSEFNSYKPKRKIRKMDEIIKQLEKKEMPLNSYLWIHTDAKLSDAQVKAVSDWATAMKMKIAEDSAKNH